MERWKITEKSKRWLEVNYYRKEIFKWQIIQKKKNITDNGMDKLFNLIGNGLVIDFQMPNVKHS